MEFSGGAIAADTYAREFARKKGLKHIEYFPNYDKYGKVAEMVEPRLKAPLVVKDGKLEPNTEIK